MKNLDLTIGQETTLDNIFDELGCMWGAVAFADLLENKSVDNYDGNKGVNVEFDIVSINETHDYLTIVKITDIFEL